MIIMYICILYIFVYFKYYIFGIFILVLAIELKIRIIFESINKYQINSRYIQVSKAYSEIFETVLSVFAYSYTYRLQ